LHGDYPCLEESKLLCADVTDPDEIFQCLSEFLDSKNKKKKLSESCRSIVAGYKTCSSEAEQQPEDGPPEESDGSAGPKPPPKDRDDGDEDKDSKPAPADKLPPQSQSQRRLQKSKPAPKPKPGPGGEKPCWARGAGSDGDVDVDGSSGTDVGLQDGSNPLQQQHGSSSNGSSNSTISVTAIGMPSPFLLSSAHSFVLTLSPFFLSFPPLLFAHPSSPLVSLFRSCDHSVCWDHHDSPCCSPLHSTERSLF
jgi:hypothetical protein